MSLTLNDLRVQLKDRSIVNRRTVTSYRSVTVADLVELLPTIGAEKVDWCQEHESNWSTKFHVGDGQIRRCRYAQGAGLRGQCSVAPMLILKVETDELQP